MILFSVYQSYPGSDVSAACGIGSSGGRVLPKLKCGGGVLKV